MITENLHYSKTPCKVYKDSYLAAILNPLFKFFYIIKTFQIIRHHIRNLLIKKWDTFSSMKNFHFERCGKMWAMSPATRVVIVFLAIFVTADLVELYPSVPQKFGLRALMKALKRKSNSILIDNHIQMAKLVLKKVLWLLWRC